MMLLITITNQIENLIEKVDTLIIGGGMAYTFFKQKDML